MMDRVSDVSRLTLSPLSPRGPQLKLSDQSKVQLVQAGAAHARLGDQTWDETTHVDRGATGGSQATKHPESTGKRRRGRMDVSAINPEPSIPAALSC